MLWLDAVAQLVACSSLCYEHLMCSPFFKAWMESALILIQFSAVEFCSVSLPLCMVTNLASFKTKRFETQVTGDSLTCGDDWSQNTFMLFCNNIPQGFNLSSYILPQPTNMCCVSSNYLLTWSPWCLSWFLLWWRCTFSLLPNLGRCLWSGICPCSYF